MGYNPLSINERNTEIGVWKHILRQNIVSRNNWLKSYKRFNIGFHLSIANSFDKNVIIARERIKELREMVF